MATPRAAVHRDLEQRLRNIEHGLREARTAATRRPKFKVSSGDLTIDGGNLTVDGGDFLLLDTDGSTVFRLGPQEYGDRGVGVYREDGTRAILVAERFAGSTFQSVSLYNHNGKAMLQEEELGDGLAAPFFPIPMQPVTGTPTASVHGLAVDVTDAAFVSTHQAGFPRQNQFMRLQIAVRASDATTAAELRVVSGTGAVLGAFLAGPWIGVHPTGSTAWTVHEPDGANHGLFAPGTYTEVVQVAVQVRRTAGTGTLSVAVPYAHGSAGSWV